MVVTKEARVKATKIAQVLRMGRTMVNIQNGCSVEEAAMSAFQEHLDMHKNCPCCRGSEIKAVEIYKIIASIMSGI